MRPSGKQPRIKQYIDWIRRSTRMRVLEITPVYAYTRWLIHRPVFPVQLTCHNVPKVAPLGYRSLASGKLPPHALIDSKNMIWAISSLRGETHNSWLRLGRMINRPVYPSFHALERIKYWSNHIIETFSSVEAILPLIDSFCRFYKTKHRKLIFAYCFSLFVDMWNLKRLL